MDDPQEESCSSPLNLGERSYGLKIQRKSSIVVAVEVVVREDLFSNIERTVKVPSLPIRGQGEWARRYWHPDISASICSTVNPEKGKHDADAVQISLL